MSIKHNVHGFSSDCECKRCEIKTELYESELDCQRRLSDNPIIVKEEKFQCGCGVCLREVNQDFKKLYQRSEYVKDHLTFRRKQEGPHRSVKLYFTYTDGIATQFIQSNCAYILAQANSKEEKKKELDKIAKEDYPAFVEAVQNFRQQYKRPPPCFRERQMRH